MSREIILFDNRPVQGAYDKPNVTNNRLDPKIIQGILNAWDNFTEFDDFGRLWINSEGVHVVLRTSKENAAYWIASLPDEQKYRKNQALLIKGESVCYLLDSLIQNARSMLRENYISYSQLVYISIRDCSRARELRGQHYEYTKKIVRTLKKKRITDYQIGFDELTGETLHGPTAEFSHIRSVSLFPSLASHLDNGLVVNNCTHRIITANNINDENELFDLCNLNNWDINWYYKYKSYLQQIGH